MSKRRGIKKPSYIISDDEDDEDFILPAPKRTKSSQNTDKVACSRSKQTDRVLSRDLLVAKERSLNDKENRSKNSLRDSDGPKTTCRTHNTKQNSILVSSQSSSEGTSNASPDISQLQLSSVENSRTKATRPAKPSDSDDEFKLSQPASEPTSESDPEFKISQLSSVSSAASEDEEFKLSSGDEFAPEKAKPRVSNSSKAKKKSDKSVSQNITPKLGEPKVGGLNSESPNLGGRNLGAPISKPSVITSSKPTAPRRTQKLPSRPAQALRPAGVNKTVNIPAILSQSSSAQNTSPLGVKIGLSRNARFKSLHSVIKR